MSTTLAEPLFAASGISKSFPGVHALADARFDLHAGEIHALVGENGAGKSTLMKIIAGVYQADAGAMMLDGEPVDFKSPRQAVQHGIGLVHQELSLAQDLTVAENVFLGRFPHRRGLVKQREMCERARAVLAQLGTTIDPNTRVGNLSISQKQLVEIAKVYASGPRIIALDEPTSSLTEYEVGTLLQTLRSLRERGVAIVYVSHRLPEIFSVADRVTVMRDGRHVDTRPIQELTRQRVVAMMVGRDLQMVFPKRSVPIGETVLGVDKLTRHGSFEDVSFEVRAGEVLGVAGLVGAGRSEVARAIYGLDRPDSGRITVRGAPLKVRSVLDAVQAGIALVPEDRLNAGVVPQLSVRANISTSVLRRISRRFFLRRKVENQLADRMISKLAIFPTNREAPIKHLSGGNQQKAIIARCLACESSVLILDEPTRGVDVGAKTEIYTILGDLVEAGVAIIVISSELEEVLAVSDRVIVLHQGRVTATLSRADATEHSVMLAATGEAG